MVLSRLRAAIWTEDADPWPTGDQAGGWEGANDEKVAQNENRAIEFEIIIQLLNR